MTQVEDEGAKRILALLNEQGPDNRRACWAAANAPPATSKPTASRA